MPNDGCKKKIYENVFISLYFNKKKMSLLTRCPETDLYVLIQNVPFSLWLRAWNKMTLFGLSTFKFNVPYQMSLSFAIKVLKLNDLFRFFRFLCPLPKCPFSFTIKSLKWNDRFWLFHSRWPLPKCSLPKCPLCKTVHPI